MESSTKTIVTAADAKFFPSLYQFIRTYKKKESKNSQLVCYNLGFTNHQLEQLTKIKKDLPNFSIQKFDFDKYPDFVKLSYQTYSFKPIIVKKILNEKKGNILWLDSATLLLKPIDGIWQYLERTGFYTPMAGFGSFPLKHWTVQKTLDFMNVPKHFYEKRNMFGGVCGFSYDNIHARQLVDEWERYSLIHECIKPKGANKSNHKEDQSILTILIHKLAEDNTIERTSDEVNISSKNPVKSYSVRNKLSPSFPLGLVYWSIWYFKIRRQIDIFVNKWTLSFKKL